MSYRTEISVPINRDRRTMEQRRREMFSTLESSVTRRSTSTVTHSSTIGGKTTQSTKHEESHSTSHGGAHDLGEQGSLLDDEIKNWISDSRTNWDEEIQKLRRNMISMNTNTSTSTTRITSTSNQQQQNQNAITSSQQLQQTQEEQQKRQIQEKQLQQKQQILEEQQRTTSTTQSKAVVPSNQSTTVVDQSDSSDLLMDMMANAFEAGEDGQVHFKVRFDASTYSPDEINVSVDGSKLTVSASHGSKDGAHQSFSRTIEFPSSVDKEKFTCEMTEDGILVVDAPVKEQHKAITFHGGLGIRAVASDANNQLVISGKTGPVVQKDANGASKIHVEVTVDSAYTPSDITVRTEGHKILISGRHEVKSGNSSSFKQFSKYYEIPQVIDPLAPTAQLINGTLIIEAPLVG